MFRHHYDLFLDTIKRLYFGFHFNIKREQLYVPPIIPSPYDILKDVSNPIEPIEKFIATLPEDFRRNAKTEMYRSGRGWIDRGLREGKLIKFEHEGNIRLAPKLSSSAVGIDSSSNIFSVCCFDNYQGGIVYIDKYINIPKSKKKNEYKWQRLDTTNRNTLSKHLKLILNISCRGVFTINTNIINSTNKLTQNQLVGLIEGCFTGYETHPEQNGVLRTKIKNTFFDWCNEIPIHCDPDFQTLRPDKIVKILVQTLSKRKGIVQECTPIFATLESEKSTPIQLSDLIVGTINYKLRNMEDPPQPFKRLLFDNRKLSKKLRREHRWAKGYYWLR